MDPLFEVDPNALVVVYNAHPDARRVLVFRHHGQGDWGLRDFFLDPQDDAALVGQCYEDSEDDEATEALGTSRIHSPGTPASKFAGVVAQVKGKGYGATMYMAAAVAIKLERDRPGVHSGSDLGPGRSASASALWAGLVKRGIAEHIEVEGEKEEEDWCGEVEACADVPDEITVRRKGRSVDRRTKSSEVCRDVEVCGTVTVEDDVDVDVLYAEAVQERPVILAVNPDSDHDLDGDFESPGDAEMVTVKLPRMPDSDRVRMFADWLYDTYGAEASAAFASRPDVAPHLDTEGGESADFSGTKGRRFRGVKKLELSAKSRKWAETMEGLD